MGNFLLITIFNPHNFDKVIKQPQMSDNYIQKSNNITGSGFRDLFLIKYIVDL